MQNVMSIGKPPWTRSEILDHLDEFKAIYADRPMKDNQGGMKAPHMFALWFIAKYLSPDLVVESGVWKGQSTWLLEKACPDARLVSIDLSLSRREYISDRVIYSDRDFVEQDWSQVTDRSLVFFDDHQNAYKRLQQCKWFGFKHVIFDDNYPAAKGDCYSLKKALANAGFKPVHSQQQDTYKSILARVLKRAAQLIGPEPIDLIPQYDAVEVQPNSTDSRMLVKHLQVYYEFPPVFKAAKTRWGAKWDEVSYPTPAPLLDEPARAAHKLFADEAVHYTWICYAKLK